MKEILDQIFSYIRSILRFRWLSLSVAWAIAIIGWSLVFVIPDKYEASARVNVDTESLLRPLLKGMAVESDISNRVALMNRTLLSRPNLEKVARATDLDLMTKNKAEFEAMILGLEKDISISSGGRRDTNIYTITYENSDSELARKVVESLLNIFVETTLGQKRDDVGNAQAFLDQQIKEYEQRLVEAENRLMEFKRKNVGLLPEQGVDFYARFRATRAELEKGKLELREYEFKREQILNDIGALEARMSNTSQPGIVTSVDARLVALRGKLDELLLRFTDAHPDVEQLKESIALLEKQQVKELEEKQKKFSEGVLDESPMYQELKIALSQANANLAAARVRVNEYTDRLQKLQEMVDTLPKVEAELKRLDRDYGVNRVNYEELLARRETARISQDVDQSGDNIKFNIIDPPRVPLLPSSPNRPLLSSVVLFFAIGISGLLAIVMAEVRPTINSQQNLINLTGYPVIGTITQMLSSSAKRKKRLEILRFSILTICLVGLYVSIIFMYVSEFDYRTRLLESIQGMIA